VCVCVGGRRARARTHTRTARVPLTARDKSPLSMLAPRIPHKSGVHEAIHTYVPFKRARIKDRTKKDEEGEKERKREGRERRRTKRIEKRMGFNGVPRT